MCPPTFQYIYALIAAGAGLLLFIAAGIWMCCYCRKRCKASGLTYACMVRMRYLCYTFVPCFGHMSKRVCGRTYVILNDDISTDNTFNIEDGYS